MIKFDDNFVFLELTIFLILNNYKMLDHYASELVYFNRGVDYNAQP